eukprot:m.35042 g.35042  ORF g.35042 m.35042 type:complete len:310 (+) comp11095_c0_seq2:609-1538(+)
MATDWGTQGLSKGRVRLQRLVGDSEDAILAQFEALLRLVDTILDLSVCLEALMPMYERLAYAMPSNGFFRTRFLNGFCNGFVIGHIQILREDGTIITMESNGLPMSRGNTAVESICMNLVSKTEANKGLIIVDFTFTAHIAKQATNTTISIVASLRVRSSLHAPVRGSGRTILAARAAQSRFHGLLPCAHSAAKAFGNAGSTKAGFALNVSAWKGCILVIKQLLLIVGVMQLLDASALSTDGGQHSCSLQRADSVLWACSLVLVVSPPAVHVHKDVERAVHAVAAVHGAAEAAAHVCAQRPHVLRHLAC